MEIASLSFIALLGGRRRPILLNTFDEEHWFRSAYGTFSRTLLNALAEGEKNQLRRRIFAAFRGFNDVQLDRFDARIEDLILTTANDFTLTIGQSQKLINILLKYHACLYYSHLTVRWNEDHGWIGRLSGKFHVPIDSIVLFRLCEVAPDECAGLVRATAVFREGEPQWTFNGKVCHTRANGNRGAWFPWSKIEDYQAYFKLQNIIRGLADIQEISPLLYEMRYLWKTSFD